MIESVSFSCLSPDRIRAISMCEVTSDELYSDGRPKRGGLRDPRFGVSSRHGLCTACNQTWTKCAGHFGHYELPTPLFHIGWISEVLFWLRRTCTSCSLAQCNKIHKKCTQCNKSQPKFTKKNATTLKITDQSGERDLLACEAYDILSKISTENMDKLRDDHFHPKWLILTVLVIPPNCVRPSPTLDGDEVRGEDDITRRLLYILRVCKAYKKITHENTTVIGHYKKKVQDALHMYIDQTRMNTKNKNAGKCLADRLRGKKGRLRGSLMGKRCNFTARTVISGDAMLDMRDVGIPQQVADTLTLVERVNRLNYKEIKSMVAEQDKRIKYIVKKDGTRLDMNIIKGRTEVQIGDAVERTLKNGDLVLFNRQPSLHRMSIMCHRVKILQGKTFRLNLTCTTPYNADFDGDEMNLHALQTYESRADAWELMSVAKNIITPQANKPVMGIVQDSLLSAYLMTTPGVLIDRALMSNIMMWIEDATELPEPNVQTEEGHRRWTGLQCMSMLFPKDFNWKDTIFKGQLLKGPLGKKALGRSHGSIIHRLYNDYGPDRTCKFINELQRTNHVWFSTRGFSIGIGDMRISKETAQKVRAECADLDAKAAQIRQQNQTGIESKINRMLNQTRDSMGLIAQNAMSKDNCLGNMVKSGSKGSMVNILQIMACVGQQNCLGKRIQPTLKGRTLPMFHFDDQSARSRGFVRHSYMDGLTPDEYWHHTAGGREGLVDTAVKTSTTGYIQRRLVKSLESVSVSNDNTVRDASGRIVQFKYGEDGLDGMAHEMVDCPFDEMLQLSSDYNTKEWPELTDAFKLWKWNQSSRLGNKWAISCPAGRILENYKDGGSISSTMVREIIQPLLQDTADVPLAHIYILATFAKRTIACSKTALQKITDILLKKWHRSIVAPGEMVGTIAAQSVGEPTTQMTLNSVDYDTELIIRWNGHVHAVRNGSVGMLIDSLMESHSAQIQNPEPNTEYLPILDGLAEALTVDEYGNVTWETLEAVTRHPPVNKDGTNTLVRVKTKSGRDVTATKAKSFLVVKDGHIETKDGASIQVGDMIPVIQTLPTSPGFTTLEVINYLSPTEFVFTSITSKIDMTPWSWFGQYKDKVPYNRSDSCKVAMRREPRFRTAGFVFPKHIRHLTCPIPDILELNRDSGFFFGAYLAEGCATAHQIHIANNDANYREKAAIWPTSLGIKHHVTAPAHRQKNNGTSISIMFHSSVLTRLMETLCNHGSWVKKVPSFVFSAPKDFVEGLLDAYFSGDGSVAKNGAMTTASRSKLLTEGIGLLLKNYGIYSTMMSYDVNSNPMWALYISIEGGQKFMQHIHLTTTGKAKRLEGASVKKKRRTAEVLKDVFLDEVLSVEEVPSSHPFVYDLTVAKTRNMVTASGMCVRDTFHNAGNSAKNVTLGVPRFEELINASQKIKTPSLTIVTDEYDDLNPQKAWKIKTDLEKRQLKDLVVQQSYNVQDFPELEQYLECPDNNRWTNINQTPRKILHCVLSRKKMVQSNIDIYQIIDILRTQTYIKHMIFAYSDNLGDPHLFAKAKKSDKFFQFAKQILETTVKGSKYIPKVNITTRGNKFVINTEGIDLDHIKTIKSVDHKKVQCNDIFAILKIYGIEAARAALLKEMHQVLDAYGIYVNHRHFMVIADWMTLGGNVTALTRHGVKKRLQSEAPLKRATFEQPVEIFHHAAVKGLTDHVQGISEQLLVGKLPKCGSGYNTSLTDPAYKQQWDQDDWQPEEEVEESLEDLFGPWVPQQSNCDSSWQTHTTFATTAENEGSAWQQQHEAPEWQQQQTPAWQQQQTPAWQQQQTPAWQQQQTPAWQQQQTPAWQQQQTPASPAYSPASPAYSPASPAYSPASPAYSPKAGPVYSPKAGPVYSPGSPAYSPASPAYSPKAGPVYSPGSPAYSPGNPCDMKDVFVIENGDDSPNKRRRVVP